MKSKKTSVHHILPKSRAGTNDEENLVRLNDTTHRAIHTLFANQLIAEQLITTVDLSAKALRPEVRERLIEILSKDKSDLDFWYKDSTHF